MKIELLLWTQTLKEIRVGLKKHLTISSLSLFSPFSFPFLFRHSSETSFAAYQMFHLQVCVDTPEAGDKVTVQLQIRAEVP